MKQVTPDVTARADRVAAQAVETAQANAEREGRTLDPYTAYLLHKATWAGVTGGDAVQVVTDPAAAQ